MLKSLKKNLEGSERKITSHIKRQLHKGISGFRSRNFISQKRIVGYIYSTKKRNLQPEILYLGKLFRIEGEIVFQANKN